MENNLKNRLVFEELTLQFIKSFSKFTTDTSAIRTENNIKLYDFNHKINSPLAIDVCFRLNKALNEIKKDNTIYPFLLKRNVKIKKSIINNFFNLKDFNDEIFLTASLNDTTLYLCNKNNPVFKEIISLYLANEMLLDFAYITLSSEFFGNSDKTFDIF